MNRLLSLGVIALWATCAIAASGCSKSSAPSTNLATSIPAAANAVKNTAQNAAQSAAGLRCSDEVVWVNLKSRAFHEPGDPYYGKTTHGKYMCRADALAAGYHQAGASHMRVKNMHAPGGVPTPAETASPY